MARLKKVFGLTVLLLAAWLIGQRIYAIRSDRNGRTTRAEEKAQWASRLEPALATIHGWTQKPEQTCTLAATDAPWFAYTATAPDGSVIEATSRTPRGPAAGTIVVGAREHEGAISVVVMDLATGKALCWTEEAGPATVHDRVHTAAGRISPSTRLVD